jgi:hypothetical protein
MKRSINNPDPPTPVSLTLEQLAAVASDTGAMLGAGGGAIMICGGYPPYPLYKPVTSVLTGVVTPTLV